MQPADLYQPGRHQEGQEVRINGGGVGWCWGMEVGKLLSMHGAPPVWLEQSVLATGLCRLWEPLQHRLPVWTLRQTGRYWALHASSCGPHFGLVVQRSSKGLRLLVFKCELGHSVAL